jgi:tetratricopeptide (TPR) repeat protein
MPRLVPHRSTQPLVLALFAGVGLAGLVAWWRGLSPRRRLEPALFVAVAALLCNLPLVSSREIEALTQTNLGVALAREGHSADAEACHRAAIRLAPRNAAAHNNLGILLVSTGNLREGIAEFKTALEIRPSFAEASANLERALAMSRSGEELPTKSRFG